MAVNGARVRFRRDEVLVAVKRATDKNIDRIALWIEGQAKVNIQANGQIDTGFMLNATYTILSEQSSYDRAPPTGPNGQVLAPAASLPEKASAAVCNGARYAIYQEAIHSFLYQAGTQASSQLGGEKLHLAISQDLHDE